MNNVPKVAAVHDLSGLGRCSLAVVLPVLSAMGVQCCPLTTAVLSAHTAFPHSQHAAFRDLTPEMVQTMAHWNELGTVFDAIYSGFLGSELQIGLLRQFCHEAKKNHTLIFVDPVMGDYGKPYRTYTPNMCAGMRELANEADLITPNLTEAALLLEEPFGNVPTTQQGTEDWLRRLSHNGTCSVVLTGVAFSAREVGAGCFDSKTNTIHFAMAPQEPAQFSGTGDLFASVTIGALLRGEPLNCAVQQAVDFVRSSVARTIADQTPHLDGVRFEPMLPQLLGKRQTRYQPVKSGK